MLQCFRTWVPVVLCGLILLAGCAGREAATETEEALPEGPPEPTPPVQIEPPKAPLLARIWDTLIFWDNDKRDQTPRASLPLWIGTVRLVNDRGGFVLIENTSAFSIPSGKKLTVVVPGREDAELEVSQDRQHPFFIADILTGAPRVGDRVYSPD